jgi:hypothetical protein
LPATIAANPQRGGPIDHWGRHPAPAQSARPCDRQFSPIKLLKFAIFGTVSGL